MNISKAQDVIDPTNSPYFERAVYIYPANTSVPSAVWTREMRAAFITEADGPID